MTIKLSSFGGGGGFTSRFASATIIVAIGATGTYVTLTPPSGQKVMLTALACDALQTNLTTVTVGVTDVVIGETLDTTTGTPVSSGEFKIGFNSPAQQPIVGGSDEVIELKTNVATSSNTIYAYQFGV